MVLKERVAQKFVQLDEYISIIKDISKTKVEDFLKDRILIGSAKYYLQISIECCIDVANHTIASEKLRSPNDYSDSFAVLHEKGIIPEKLSLRLQQAAKFRNRLVHLYGEIDDHHIYTFISSDYMDLLEFKNLIVKRFLTS